MTQKLVVYVLFMTEDFVPKTRYFRLKTLICPLERLQRYWIPLKPFWQRYDFHIL